MRINPKNILIAFAMREESQTSFDDLNVIHTGIGKINAAHSLTKAIATTRPDLVINMGTAGSSHHKGGSVINPTRFIQRDMDVTALGFEKYKTPFSDDPVIIEHGLRIDNLPHGTCGSGDSFATAYEQEGFDVVDMEAYALALICKRENIPFLCLKYISDGADENANQDWNAALQHAAKILRQALDKSLN